MLYACVCGDVTHACISYNYHIVHTHTHTHTHTHKHKQTHMHTCTHLLCIPCFWMALHCSYECRYALPIHAFLTFSLLNSRGTFKFVTSGLLIAKWQTPCFLSDIVVFYSILVINNCVVNSVLAMEIQTAKYICFTFPGAKTSAFA